jgi:site-specific DNA-methyltransferase (adenine-specific)
METCESQECERKDQLRRKYTPDLGYFKFKPKNYWNADDARHIFENQFSSAFDLDTIRFEDCISGMEKMPEGCVDLVVADPPFGIEFSGKESNYNRNNRLVVDSYHEIDENYGEFTEKWMAATAKIMKPQATAYVFSGWNHLEEVLRSARLAGLTTINHLIWKYQFGVFTKNKYVTSHYHILLLAKNSGKYYFNKMEHYPLDIWDIKRKYKKGEIKNATTLPTEVIKKCIEFSSKPGDVVFDPFMGTATTAVVAKSIWRHYFGFELNENMRSPIQNRIENVTLGEEYISLDERLSKIQDDARGKYPQAYKAFLEESRGKKVAKS